MQRSARRREKKLPNNSQMSRQMEHFLRCGGRQHRTVLGVSRDVGRGEVGGVQRGAQCGVRECQSCESQLDEASVERDGSRGDRNCQLSS